MNTFYIARHGETENNRAGRLSGWIDTPLTEHGLLPTETVIAKLKHAPIQHIYSSDLGRAFMTAYVIARKRNFTGEIQRLSGLREVNYGEVVANMLSAQAYEQYPELDRNTHFTPPNGESLAHMQARVIKTINEVDAAHTNATVLFVAHSGVMAAIASSRTGQDFGEHNISEAYPHDYVARFTVVDEKIASFEAVS